ncbi:MAG: hypothetical protein EOM54_12245 [Clostridia bacterium]|nr:hypothetical protein [Clostridia bacterium]
MKVKKFLSIFLAVAMVVSLMPGITIPASATDPSTSLSVVNAANAYNAATNPLEISSAGDLAYLAQQVNSGGTITYTDSGGAGNTIAASSASYKLTADLVMNENASNYANWGTDYPFNTWAPIGSETYNFGGVFDGDGHTVSGLYINTTSTYRGLFGYINGSGVMVKNVSVIDSYIKGGSYTAGVVGVNNGGTVQNCYNTGIVSGDTTVGGVVGYNSGTVSYCYNANSVGGSGFTGGVTGNNSGMVSYCYNFGGVNSSGSQAGGVVGINLNSGTVQYCYNTGSVINTNTKTGGVTGSNAGTTQYCYSAGNVKGLSEYLGSVAGYNTGTVTGCYYDKQMCQTGGIDGSDVSGSNSARGKLTSEMMVSATFSGWGSTIWNFTSNLYPMLTGYVDATTDYHMDETAAACVSVSPVFLTGSQTAASVTSDFTVSTANSVVWDSGDSDIVSLLDTAATLAGSGDVTLTASRGGISKAVTLTTVYSTYSVSGTVSPGTTGAPVNDLTVTLYSSGGATSHTDTTDGSGAFEITGVPVGTYTAVIATLPGSHGRSSSASFQVSNANVTGANITLATGPDYVITNDADGKFLVGSGTTPYNTLALALNECMDAGNDHILNIQFGNGSVPLEVTGVSRNSIPSSIALSAATYSGSVNLSYTFDGNEGIGLYVSGYTVFHDLTITTSCTGDSADEEKFYAVELYGSPAELNVSGNTSITSSSPKGVCVFAHGGGTLNVTGGSLYAQGTDGLGVYVDGGTANISGGTVRAIGSGISSSGDVTVSGSALITAGDYGIYSSGSNATLNINGGTIEATGVGGKAVAATTSGGTVNMTDGIVRATNASNTAQSVGLLNSNNTAANISGGTITCAGTYSISAGIYQNSAAAVTITGGSISGANHGIYNMGTKTTDNGSVYINGGSVSATGSIHSYAVYNRVAGLVKIASGTITSSGYAVCNSSTGEVAISGGTLRSTGTHCLVNSDGGTLTITGGTISSESATSAAIAVSVITAARTSTVSISGSGTNITSACSHTISIAQPSGADRALSVSLYEEIIHGSVSGIIYINGSASAGKYKIDSSSYANATLTASDITTGRSFAGWASDSGITNTISETNGDTVSHLTTGDNVSVTDIYLKTGTDTAVILAADSLGTAGSSSITGLTSNLMYRVKMGSVVYFVKADGTLSSSFDDAAALTGTAITGLVNGTTYKVELNLPLDAWSGEYTSTLVTGSYGTGNGELAEAAGTAVDSAGNIYVVDKKNNRVVKYNSIGVYQSSFNSADSGGGQFSGPYGIAIDSNDNIYVMDSGNQRVQKFNSSGAYVSQFSDGITTTLAMFIAIDSSDNIYITENTTKKVFKYNSAGVKQLEISVTQTSSNGIRGVAVDSDGTIYVGAQDCKIYKYSTDGTYISSFGEDGSEPGELNGIKGLKADSQNNIWVADTVNNRISVFSSAGAFIRTIGSKGHAAGELRCAQELWITDDGTVYVADTGNYRIQKFEKRPYISSAGHDSITISATAKQQEDIYWVVLPSAANAPTNTQVMAGTDAEGTALASGMKGSASASAEEVKTLSVTGLTPNTPYCVYLMAADGTGLKSATVKLGTTTDFHVTAPTGTGTNADPYIMDNPEDLLWLSRQCAAGNTSAGSAYYRQTADIDMNAVANFVPIGANALNSPFTGNYDGGNYKITNLNITDNAVKYEEDYTGCYGLFGYTEGAAIKNVIIKDITIDVKLGEDSCNSESVNCYAGAIAGWTKASTITNCRVVASNAGSSTIDVTAITGRTTLSAGGIVGYFQYSNPQNVIAVEKCRSEASITGSINEGNNSYFGGIAGYYQVWPSGAKLQNCYNTGSISVSGDLGDNKSVYIGGVVGYLTNASVLNCYSTGSLTDTTAPGTGFSYQYKGGIVGSTNGSVTGCYYLAAAAANGIGSISGAASDIGAEPKTDTELKTPATYTGWSAAVWDIQANAYPVFNLTTSYSVVYNANSSTSGTVPVDNSAYAEGATVTVLANSGNLAKTGYTFAGWNTAADATGTNYAAAATFAMGAGNVTLYAKWSQNGGGGDGGNDSPAPSNNASVVVDGKTQTAGKTETTTENGKTKTTVTLASDKLKDILDGTGSGATVTIPIPAGSSAASGKLDGQSVKNMENKEAILEIKTDSATYTLPAAEINIDAVSARFGESVSLGNITVNVSIAEPSDSTVRVVENAAKDGGFAIAVQAVEFKVSCTYGGETVEVSEFNSYVERMIAIPAGVDPSKITTGIVVKPDGTVRHVPTEIVVVGGKYYAKINSLTNSVYSVIWNPIEFSDVENHWAKDSINNMGSRLVVSGVGNNNYEPDRSITRAEFAAIMVKALGLEPGAGTSSFSDVASTDWFCGYVETAASYGIVNGYGNGYFGPNDLIPREQAMTMIARAMKLTGLEVSLAESDISELLGVYADGASASDYAETGIAACLRAGIVAGTSKLTISPKNYVTRAEVAVMVEKLLQKSELI